MAARLSAEVPSNCHCVIASGSLGRFEWLPHSDADLIVVAQPHGDASDDALVFQNVWNCLQSLNLPKPLPDGVFGSAVTVNALTNSSTMGQVDEDVRVFGKRIQILLDGYPVMRRNAFHQLRIAILQRYGFRRNRPLEMIDVEALLHDLIRYHHSLHLHYRWWFRQRPDHWRSYNAKMLHSRTVMFAGLLFAMAESLAQLEDLDVFAGRLQHTPLERILRVAGPYRPAIVEAYDQHLAGMRQKGLPSDDAGNCLLSFGELENDAWYLQQLAFGRQLKDSLWQVIQDHRGDWPDDFLQSCLL
ncbi:MAG: hypothetical protein KDA87_20565 [Planctomycetales bacterium]|nr:hypothetical protein [Planctomycetales bacterium]